MRGAVHPIAETMERFILHEEMLVDDFNYLFHGYYFPNHIKLESFE